MNCKLQLIGNPGAKHILIQLVDEHDASLLQEEADYLTHLLQHTAPATTPDIMPAGDTAPACESWCIAAVPVEEWFRDLTPWKAAPVFGRQEFGDGAALTLTKLTNEVLPQLGSTCPNIENRYLCGYSLAGLFSLWAGYQTDLFTGIVAASPSVWYPDWIDYATAHETYAQRIYLSLGDKEARTKNPVMARVEEALREQHRLLQEAGCDSILEMNPGNHFADSHIRMAKGMAWMLQDARLRA